MKLVASLLIGLLLASSIAYLAIFIGDSYRAKYLFTTPKKGDVWRWHTNGGSKDPFKRNTLNPYYDYKVIAVKGDYVQYMDLLDSTIQSSSISWFKIGTEKISN